LQHPKSRHYDTVERETVHGAAEQYRAKAAESAEGSGLRRSARSRREFGDLYLTEFLSP
jgi:hypothetical protein